jgi:hypothetical protein
MMLMRSAKTSRRTWIIVLAGAMLCLCSLVVVGMIVQGGDTDPLARIAEEINCRGCCVILGAGEIRASSARRENGCLVLYGSGDPNEESCVRVALYPFMGAEGTCSAKSVSIQHLVDPYEKLTITFHQPTHLPRQFLGRSLSVPVRKHKWIDKLRFAMRDFLWHRPSQTPRSVSP